MSEYRVFPVCISPGYALFSKIPEQTAEFTSMVSGAIDILLKKGTPKGKKPLTMKSICDRKANTVLRYGRENDSVIILGESGDQEFIFDILGRLGIEPDLLLGY